jgi:hypothetical protein
MKWRWSRRELLLKSLIATGGAVAAKLSGVVPEFGWVAQAASPGDLPAPAFMGKAVAQREIVGTDAQTLLGRLSSSPDVHEVLGQLAMKPVDLQALGAKAVRSDMEDGTVVVAASAVLPDQEHVLVHYQSGARGGAAARTNAFIYHVTADRKADLVAGSADGRQMRRSQDPANLPANAALASGCPSCYYACGQVCCSYDWWGILECCVACALFWECPPCFLSCALIWCGACVWNHCGKCANCCQDWWCF